MSDQNGIKQTPFADAWATPDVGGTGVNGIGGGIGDSGGPNGIVCSPFDKAEAAPGTSETPCAELGQPAPQFVSVDGGSPAGSQMNWDITQSRNTIDKQ